MRFNSALIGILFTCYAAVGHTQGTVGAIEGVVRDSAGVPMPYVAIAVVNTIYRGETDEKGHYRIEKVPAGIVSLQARRIFYRAATIDSVVGPRHRSLARTLFSPQVHGRAARSASHVRTVSRPREAACAFTFDWSAHWKARPRVWA